MQVTVLPSTQASQGRPEGEALGKGQGLILAGFATSSTKPHDNELMSTSYMLATCARWVTWLVYGTIPMT